jgi:hypothetical protein
MSKNYSYQTEVDILVNGKPLKKYAHNGRIFIQAKEGAEYSVRIKNNYYGRKLIVPSVDGLNVVNGQSAGEEESGYVLNGYNSYEIKGFRVSNEVVNAFKFSTKPKSYAAKSDVTEGDTSNCGVIGVRAFFEKEKPQPIHITYNFRPRVYKDFDYNRFNYGSTTCTLDSSSLRCSTTPVSSSLLGSPEPDLGISAMFCADFNETPRGLDMGTEFSDKEISDNVKNVEFEKGALECEWEIYYASKGSLIEMGVSVEKEVSVAFPSAFPTKFCKPPKN